MEIIWKNRQYHVQDNYAVEHQDVKIHCNTSQWPELSFCGPHYKPYGSKGLITHYHLILDKKLGMGICAIFRIPCGCVACSSMLDKPWISSITPDEQDCYIPINKFTYWTLLGSFKNGILSNCNISQHLLTHLMKYTRLFLME